ncbi:MAG: hypothetical protein P8M70_06215, partial [Verrucomicrobiota bacterium]|nr:hypothetical protein [Verrucomicrobiota bacterium]
EIKFCVVDPLNFRGSMTVAIDWNAQLGSENAESANMIGMFVGDKDPIETLRCALKGQEALADAFSTNATVD